MMPRPRAPAGMVPPGARNAPSCAATGIPVGYLPGYGVPFEHWQINNKLQLGAGRGSPGP